MSDIYDEVQVKTRPVPRSENQAGRGLTALGSFRKLKISESRGQPADSAAREMHSTTAKAKLETQLYQTAYQEHMAVGVLGVAQTPAPGVESTICRSTRDTQNETTRTSSAGLNSQNGEILDSLDNDTEEALDFVDFLYTKAKEDVSARNYESAEKRLLKALDKLGKIASVLPDKGIARKWEMGVAMFDVQMEQGKSIEGRDTLEELIMLSDLGDQEKHMAHLKLIGTWISDSDFTCAATHTDTILARYRQRYGRKHEFYHDVTRLKVVILSHQGDYDEAEFLKSRLPPERQREGDLCGIAKPNKGMSASEKDRRLEAPKPRTNVAKSPSPRSSPKPKCDEECDEGSGSASKDDERTASRTDRVPEARNSLRYPADVLESELTPQAAYERAMVFHEQGKYDKALEGYGRALVGYEKALGKDHPSTLDMVNNMGIVFQNQGRYDEALECYRRTLAGREKVLGKDHPLTLNTVYNMGLLFQSQGRYDETLKWYARALASHEKVLGKDHPLTLEVVNNMGIVFKRQGRHDEALECYGRTLAGREKVLGKDHLSTLNTVYNIGLVLQSQGRYDETLKWYARALAGHEKVLGKDHPSTLDMVNSMGNVLGSQAKYDEALELYRRALVGYEKALGKGHSSTLDTVDNIGIVFQNQGRYDEALECYRRTLAGREKVLGKDHPSSLNTVYNMGLLFQNQGRYDEALECYARALASREKLLGKDHPSTLDMVDNMGIVFQIQGRCDEALKWYARALASREKVLGKDHPSMLATVKSIAEVSQPQGRYDAPRQIRRGDVVVQTGVSWP